MLRQTLVRRLRAIGEIPVPEGHLRRNKGITTYFFSKEKQQEILEFLRSLGLEEREHGPQTAPGISFRDTTSNLSFWYNDEGFVSVSIVRWPA